MIFHRHRWVPKDFYLSTFNWALVTFECKCGATKQGEFLDVERKKTYK